MSNKPHTNQAQQPPKSKSRKISTTTPAKKQVVIPHLMRNLLALGTMSDSSFRVK